MQLAIQRGVASLIVFESRWQIEHRIICSLLPPSLSPSFLPSFSIHHSAFSDRKGAERRGNREVGLLAAPPVRSAAAVRSARFGKLEFVLLFCRIATELGQDARAVGAKKKAAAPPITRSLITFSVNIQQTFTRRCYNLESIHRALMLI